MKLLLKLLFVISLFPVLSTSCADKKDENKPTWKTHVIDISRGLTGGILLQIADKINVDSFKAMLGVNLLNIILDSKESLKPSLLGIFKRLVTTFIGFQIFEAIRHKNLPQY